jgi:hypothetical protein
MSPQSQFLEPPRLSGCRTQITYRLSEINTKHYWHDNFKIGRFFVLWVQKLARANGYLSLKALFLVFLPLKRHFFKLEQNGFICRSENLVFILDAQPVERRLDVFVGFFISGHFEFLEMLNVSLTRVAKTRYKHEPFFFLFLDVNLDFFKEGFTHSIGFENHLDLRDFVWLNDAIHWDVSNGSGRVAVEDAFADSLDQVLDGEVADVFDGECFF